LEFQRNFADGDWTAPVARSFLSLRVEATT
jgi:hypothetical protein